MRSSPSSINRLNQNSSIIELSASKKPSVHLENLQSAGLKSLDDLLWVLPLRAIPMPKISPYSQLRLNEIFLGQGKIIHKEIRPAFGRRTKGKFLLYNAYLIVQELNGNQTIALRWFNVYPSQKKQMETLDQIWFLGTPQEWRAQIQIVNPKIHPLDSNDWSKTFGGIPNNQ